MNAILEKNLKAFFKRYPLSKKRLEEKIQKASTQNFSIKDECVYEGSVMLDSSAADFVSLNSYKLEHTKLLFIEGLGLGHLVRKAVDRFQGRVRDVLILEPSIEAFAFVISQKDFSENFADPRFHWIIGQDEENCFADFLEFLRVPERAFQMDAFQFIAHPVISKKYQKYFEVVRDEWDAARKQIRRGYGGIEDSLLGFEHVVRNLDFIESNPGIILTKDLFQKVPAIIVSAGPSLDKSIPALKKLQDKAVIIAVDACLNILLENGISPHAVVTIERDMGPKVFFEATHKKFPANDTHLFAFPLARPDALAAYKGPKWVAYRDYGYFQYFEQQLARGMISSSSSVAHFALRTAFCFGCSPVLLVGQDLAYEPKTLRSHAQGLAYEGWDKPKTEAEVKANIQSDQLGELFYVEGNKEKQVPTNSTYFSFLKEFSWEATRLPFKIFNCTEGGAKIPNIESASIADVTSQWKTHSDLRQRLSDLRKKIESKKLSWKETTDYLQSLSTKLQEMSQAMASPDLSLEQKMQIATLIRQAQVELMKDQRYICFVIQNAGREYLDFENEWATRVEDPSFSANERLAYLDRGLHLVQGVTQRMVDLFHQVDSSRQKMTSQV
ncbi:MAG: motility associated factor glycosyltransferase family protein [Deltaproteobacteria bacterium]|nr:motility associated factor glycosyltransferase family protein [Deltaproteobacteria bacterium]